MRKPETRSGIFAWLAAFALCSLSGVTLKATPEQAVELVRAAEHGDLDETAIAAKLAESSN